MLLTQNSHLYSTTSNRLFYQSQKSIERSVERLASAKRVNSARDDAAGLSIHTRLEQQIRTASKERANLQQQISFAQTAQGTLGEVQERLMRLREIGVQAANATLNEQDRKSLQSEAEGLLKTIDELAQSEFNQQKIFGRSYTFDTGKTEQNPRGLTRLDLNDLESTSFTRVSRNTSSLGVNAFVDWQQGDIRFGQDIRLRYTSYGLEPIGGVEVRATQASDDTLSTEYNAGSAIAKAAAINAGTRDHGVSAEVHAATARLTINSAINLENVSFDINGLTVKDLQIMPGDGGDTLINYLNDFSDQTGVVASRREFGEVLLTAEDGRNIIIEASNHDLANQLGFFGNQKPSFQYDKKIVVGGKLSLFSEQDYQLYYDNPIMNESLGLIHDLNSFNTDFVDLRMESGGKMTFHRTGLREGFPFANAYTEDSNSEIPSYLHRIDGDRINSFRLNNWKNHLSSFRDMDGPIELIYAFESPSYLRQLNFRENTIDGDPLEGLGMITESQWIRRRNSSYYYDGNFFFNDLALEFDASKMNLIDMHRAHGADSVDAFKMSVFEPIYYSNNVNLLVSNHPSIVSQGLVQMNGDHQEMEVIGIDFESQERAVASLAIIDRALGEVMANQIDLGALQNSLEHSINRVEQSQSDLTQADERIVSADFAVETAELTRAQIQQSLGQEMLSKVNIDSQLALALVRSGRRKV